MDEEQAETMRASGDYLRKRDKENRESHDEMERASTPAAERARLVAEYAHHPLVRMYRIFTMLRERRPDSFQDDFKRILAALTDEGPDEANCLVRELLLD